MKCLYLGRTGELHLVEDDRLNRTSERHKIDLTIMPYDWQGPPLEALARDASLEGLILEVDYGFVGRNRIRIAERALAQGVKRVWGYWPFEQAVECIDDDRLRSLWRHWCFIKIGRPYYRVTSLFARLSYLLKNGRLTAAVWRRATTPAAPSAPTAPAQAPQEDRTVRPADLRLEELENHLKEVRPVPFAPGQPTAGAPIPGCGVYLRTDFWAKIESGGSYGHTCYVAKELAAVTERFVSFLAHPYRLLDDYGLRQVIVAPPAAAASEIFIVNATAYYVTMLTPVFEALRPAYIYERLCLGNYAGAVLSRTLGIPYIVEYNGSEISMRRSFDGEGYMYEYEYLRAEMLAFRQATMISVVSVEVRNDLVRRGVDPDKILVNPNGADLAAYAPPTPDERSAIRSGLDFTDTEVVIGFTGTFGGWHGIDVLAAAIPQICHKLSSARFLLIGDGNYKHLVDEAVVQHRLQPKVKLPGRVPQAEGARLLKACDIFVSPHNSHMVDSKFFGSPTKIFEYMAMGSGIVASDLEQIGQILSPALRLADFAKADLEVTDQRSVLCNPGDVDGFSDAVVALARRPDLWRTLGGNARAAVEQQYSWERHVARLWPFIATATGGAGTLDDALLRDRGVRVDSAETPIVTGDKYKDEVQRQWNNDPAGSHYVGSVPRHTLEWFQQAESYRYGHYAPWMLEVMEFDRHAGEQVLELGGGMGTDLAQFARHGAITTDLDLSAGHLNLAKENFECRGLQGTFVHHDAESLPFDDHVFDVVYSNGVIHHTPDTVGVVREIFRVLKPGGKAIIMVYAENSLHYWRNLVWTIGIKENKLQIRSMGEIMSRAVERSDNAAARPLVKVYTPDRLRRLFAGFDDLQIVQRQMLNDEKPRILVRVPTRVFEHRMGWNLIIKARKPGTARP